MMPTKHKTIDNKKKSTRRLVLEHICNYDTISRSQALFHYRIQNLGDVVMRLRKNGWPIRSLISKQGIFRECLYYLPSYATHYALLDGILTFDCINAYYEAPFE